MSQSLFDQLAFVRSLCLQVVQDVSEQEADIIPDGFNNNIRWNLGHVYLVQEMLAFSTAGEEAKLPEGFKTWFSMGTKPGDWEQAPPTLPELCQLLTEQTESIAETFAGRLDEASVHPKNIRNLSLQTIGEFLSFSIYHEGTHSQTMKMYKLLIRKA